MGIYIFFNFLFCNRYLYTITPLIANITFKKFEKNEITYNHTMSLVRQPPIRPFKSKLLTLNYFYKFRELFIIISCSFSLLNVKVSSKHKIKISFQIRESKIDQKNFLTEIGIQERENVSLLPNKNGNILNCHVYQRHKKISCSIK